MTGLGTILQRIHAMVTRAMVRRVRDTTLLQELQLEVRRGQLVDGAEVFGRYGFTSVPHVGAEAIAVALGGNRAHTIVLAVENRQHRMKGLAEGETAVYDDQGQAVHLKRGNIVQVVTSGTIELKAGGNTITVDAAGGITLDCPGQPFVVNAGSVDFNTA